MRGVEDKVLRVSIIALVVAGCCRALVVACGGQSPQDMRAPAPKQATAGAAEPMPGESPKQQIERLEAQIATENAKLELPEPTEEQVLAAPTQPMGEWTPAEDPKCKPANTE